MSIKDLNIYEVGLPCRISALNNYELINLGTMALKGSGIGQSGMALVLKDNLTGVPYMTISNFFNDYRSQSMPFRQVLEDKTISIADLLKTEEQKLGALTYSDLNGFILFNCIT